ncbi:MAG: site-specific integrase [Blastocatellales bacterium]|nr:site-specific integrase [Blastocatellales bacterium]
MKTIEDGIFIRKDRPGFYISWVDAAGRRRKRKVNAANITQARMIRNAELTKVEQTKALGFTPAGEESFEEVADRFLQYQRARLTDSAFDREEGIVENRLKPFFRGLKLAAVRRAEIQRYITKRSGAVGANSVIKEINVIKHMMRLAVEWELIPYSPAQGIKTPKAPPGRVRYLQPTEVRILLEFSPEWLRPIIAIAALTGMRRSEIVGLRWMDVDLNGGRILLPQTKNGDGRIVYLNASAQNVVRSLPSGLPLSRVFGEITPGQVTAAFIRLCHDVEIVNFRFHDLRHTAASWMRMAGADIHTVAQILGHKDLRMAARYQHLSPAFLADAVGKLDGVFGDLSEAAGENLRPRSVPALLSPADENALTN